MVLSGVILFPPTSNPQADLCRQARRKRIDYNLSVLTPMIVATIASAGFCPIAPGRVARRREKPGTSLAKRAASAGRSSDGPPRLPRRLNVRPVWRGSAARHAAVAEGTTLNQQVTNVPYKTQRRSRGRASLTRSARPPRSLPLSRATAASPSD